MALRKKPKNVAFRSMEGLLPQVRSWFGGWSPALAKPLVQDGLKSSGWILPGCVQKSFRLQWHLLRRS